MAHNHDHVALSVAMFQVDTTVHAEQQLAQIQLKNRHNIISIVTYYQAPTSCTSYDCHCTTQGLSEACNPGRLIIHLLL